MEDHIRAVHLLKSVGLSEYEAKAYLALLSHGEPMNGYTAAKVSGVPRSTIYQVLAKLVARGAAIAVHGVGRSTESFAALPVEAFIDGYRTKLASTLEGLAETLPLVAAVDRTRFVQKLVGRDQVLQQMNDVISKAQSHVWLSIWPAVVTDLEDNARARSGEGVEVVSVVFGSPGDLPGRVVEHRYLSPAITAERLGCRLHMAVADHQEVVIAIEEGTTWRGMWSDDLSVALLAAEHVRFDMTIQILCGEMDRSGDYEALRQHPTLRFLSRSMELGVAQILNQMPEA